MSKPPSPIAVERAMSAAMRLRETLADDQEGFTLSLDSETDVLELLDRIIEQSVSAGERAAKATERAKRLNARKDRLRDTATRMLDALGIDEPLERTLYTASISHTTKAIVTDASLLPDYAIRRAPDMQAIAKHLKVGPVPGAEQSNPAPVLTIRTK